MPLRTAQWEGTMMHCVLVIEDEADIREFLCEVFEAEGYQVLSAADADEVVPALRAAQPDLVLTDIMLHGKSGIDIDMALRTVGYQTTTFVAMSASTTMVRFARESGVFQETISKPFDLDELLGTVERLLQHD